MGFQKALYVKQGIANDPDYPAVRFESAEKFNPDTYTTPMIELVHIATAKMPNPVWNGDGGIFRIVAEDDSLVLTDIDDYFDTGIFTHDYSKLHVYVTHLVSDGSCEVTPIVCGLGRTWYPGASYFVGDVIRAGYSLDIPQIIDVVFVCTVAGVSGSTMPGYFASTTYSYGDEIIDGTVTWTASSSGNPLGVLETKTFPATAFQMVDSSLFGASNQYLTKVQTWDVEGALNLFCHVKNITGTSNQVGVGIWLE